MNDTLELIDAQDEIRRLKNHLQDANCEVLKADRKIARLEYWLGEIIRFYENGSPTKAHQFSLREAKKLLNK